MKNGGAYEVDKIDEQNSESKLVPRMWGGGRKARMNISVPPPLREYAFLAASRRGESASDFITDLLRRHMEKNERK